MPAWATIQCMSGRPSSLDRNALVALIEASRAIVSRLELDEVLGCIAEQAATVLHAQGASVLLLNRIHN